MNICKGKNKNTGAKNAQGQGRRGSSTMKFLPWMEVVVMPGTEAVGWTNRLGGRKMDLKLGALCTTMFQCPIKLTYRGICPLF